MSITNLPPTIKQETLAMAFPFQHGTVNFPALCPAKMSIFDSIKSLLLTGKNERVMRPDYGVDIHQYVFATITPILQARIATDVAEQISLYEPRAEIISVVPSLEQNNTGMETTVVIDVIYRVGNQQYEQQIPVLTTTQGA